MKPAKFSTIFILLAVLVFPVISFAMTTGGGNPWDDLIDPSPFSGTKLDGTLSIYLAKTGNPNSSCTGSSGPETNAYFTVRLSKGFQLYTFQIMVPRICEYETGPLKVNVIDFLNQTIFDIFNANLEWKFKAISNVAYNDESGSRSIVADIQIAVKEK
jgi:hypothetical protein